jgi:hypothetical protein
MFFNRQRKWNISRLLKAVRQGLPEKLKDRGANLDALDALLNVFP